MNKEDIIDLLNNPLTIGEDLARNDNEILKWAAENGHIDIVNRLLDNPAVLDNVTAQNNYALRFAAHNLHFHIVKRLLEIPTVIDAAAADDNFVLRLVSGKGKIDIVNRLLEIPAVLENVTACDNYALIWSAEGGHTDIVNRLLEIPAVRDNVATQDNYALRLAIQNGHIGTVNCLLEIPAVRDNTTVYGISVEILKYAIENGYIDILNRILEIPAVRDNAIFGDSWALQFASEKGQNEIAYTLAKMQWPGGIKEMPEKLKTEKILEAIRAGARITDARNIFVEHMDTIDCSTLPNILCHLNNSYTDGFIFKDGKMEARKRPIVSSAILNHLQGVHKLKERRVAESTMDAAASYDAPPLSTQHTLKR